MRNHRNSFSLQSNSNQPNNTSHGGQYHHQTHKLTRARHTLPCASQSEGCRREAERSAGQTFSKCLGSRKSNRDQALTTQTGFGGRDEQGSSPAARNAKLHKLRVCLLNHRQIGANKHIESISPKASQEHKPVLRSRQTCLLHSAVPEGSLIHLPKLARDVGGEDREARDNDLSSISSILHQHG